MIDSGVGVVSLPLSVIPGCAIYVDGLLIHEDNQKGVLHRLVLSIYNNNGKLVSGGGSLSTDAFDGRRWRRTTVAKGGSATKTTTERRSKKTQDASRPSSGADQERNLIQLLDSSIRR